MQLFSLKRSQEINVRAHQPFCMGFISLTKSVVTFAIITNNPQIIYMYYKSVSKYQSI